MSVKVNQCLVSPTKHPKFTADVGDMVLVRVDQGRFAEVEIVLILGNRVDCVDPMGNRIEIQADEILALCV
ncbi:MAG TPA: hypothetical protein PK306_03210 [Aquabacterium sp.]|nr:hypothetical protein [Aquabacterium sp.]